MSCHGIVESMEELQRIGELSKLTGIPTSTLRFYETHGIAHPRKQAQNQYRLYTPRDSCHFLIVKLLRSFGCNLEMASQIVTHNDLPPSLAILEEREEQLDKEIRELEERRRGLGDYRLLVEHACDLNGKIEVSERKAFYHFASIAGGQVLKNHHLKEFATLWMEHLPFLHYSMKLDPVNSGSDLNPVDDVSWGFSMDEEYAKKNRLEVPREAEYYPPSRVVETCLVRDTAGFLAPEDRRVIERFRDNAPRKFNGPIIGRFLMIFQKDGKERYLYHLSASVK